MKGQQTKAFWTNQEHSCTRSFIDCLWLLLDCNGSRDSGAKIFIPWPFTESLSALAWVLFPQLISGHAREFHAAINSWPAWNTSWSNGLAFPLHKSILRIEPHQGLICLFLCFLDCQVWNYYLGRLRHEKEEENLITGSEQVSLAVILLLNIYPREIVAHRGMYKDVYLSLT